MRPTPPARRLAIALLWAATLLSPPLLGFAERTQNELVEQEETMLVEVPVHVTLRNEPLRGLTAEQFEIYDRGKRQEIVSFDVIDLELNASGEAPRQDAELSLAARRHFLMLFDMSFTDANAIQRTQRTMRDWVRTELHPWDLVGVAIYSARTGAEMVLNFTSDREQLGLAIESLGLPQYIDRGIDPLALEIGVAVPGVSPLDAEDPGIREGAGTSRTTTTRGSDSVAALREVYYSVYEPTRKQGERHQIRALTQSMEMLADRVRAVRGRKHVVYLSQGFDASLAFAEDDPQEIARQNSAFNDSGGRISSINSADRFGDNTTINGIMTMIDKLRRADCVVQAVQVGAASGNETLSSPRAEGLFAMADGTGGELYRDYNDLDEVMSTLLQKTSVTYMLTFRPSVMKKNGRFHQLKVKVRDLPKKARIVHRPGYHEPKIGERLTAEQLRLQAAGRIMEGSDGGGSIATSLLASPFRDGSATSYVPVLIEVDGASLPVDELQGDLNLDVYLYAVADDGSIGDFFTQRLNVELATFKKQIKRGGIKLFGDLELPEGDYSLRLFVRENRLGLFSTRRVHLEAPATQGGGMRLLTPFFPDPRGKWVLVRESPEEGQTEHDTDRAYPFMRGQEPYIPAALPAVAEQSEAEVLLVTYNLGDGPVSIYTEVIDLLGVSHDQTSMRLLDRQSGVDNQDVLTTLFRPEGLTAGRYTLLVTVANDRNGRAQTNSIPIMVTAPTVQSEAAGGAR